MRAFVILLLILGSLSVAGCASEEGYSHPCSVYSPALYFLFDRGYDARHGEQILSGLGFNATTESPTNFQGSRRSLFVEGEPSNETDLEGSWTLVVYLTNGWPTTQSGQRVASDQARAEVNREAGDFIPVFERAYGETHRSVWETDSPLGCD